MQAADMVEHIMELAEKVSARQFVQSSVPEPVSADRAGWVFPSSTSEARMDMLSSPSLNTGKEGRPQRETVICTAALLYMHSGTKNCLEDRGSRKTV